MNPSDDHVLVTGAFGNIGRNVVAQLLERGYRVRATSIAPRDARIAATWSGRVEVVRGDVRDRAMMDSALRGVRTVIHLAYVIPPLAHENPELAKSVNVGGTRNLLKAARASATPPRMLFASTLDVYGTSNGRPPPRRVGDPLIETDNYSGHKIAGETMVRESGLPFAIFRFADVPPIEIRNPHPIMFRIPLDTRIEMIHPSDAALAVVNALRCDAIWGGIWNIGGGPRCQLTYRDYLGTFLDAMEIGRLPDAAFTTTPYCTDWLDTAESEALLQYQRHVFDDVVRETAALLGWRRPLARIARPIVRRAILRMSPWWRNRARVE